MKTILTTLSSYGKDFLTFLGNQPVTLIFVIACIGIVIFYNLNLLVLNTRIKPYLRMTKEKFYDIFCKIFSIFGAIILLTLFIAAMSNLLKLAADDMLPLWPFELLIYTVFITSIFSLVTLLCVGLYLSIRERVHHLREKLFLL